MGGFLLGRRIFRHARPLDCEAFAVAHLSAGDALGSVFFRVGMACVGAIASLPAAIVHPPAAVLDRPFSAYGFSQHVSLIRLAPLSPWPRPLNQGRKDSQGMGRRQFGSDWRSRNDNPLEPSSVGKSPGWARTAKTIRLTSDT